MIIKYFFCQNHLFHSSKEVFLYNLRQFLENWIFDRISTGAYLTKMVKIWTILNCDNKIFFCQNYLFHSSKEKFLHNFKQFLENWIFDRISTGADLTKMVKIWTILNCDKIFFCQNYLFHSSKEVFLYNFRQVLENWIFEGILTGTDLTKMVKIWTILNCDNKIFFCQNYLFHSSKEVFLYNFRQFLENWIFDRISTGADLTKMVKFELS